MQAEIAGRGAARLAKVLVDVAWWVTIVTVAILLFVGPAMVARGGVPIFAGVSIPDEAASRLLPLSSPDTVIAAHPVLQGVEGTLELDTSDWRLLLLGGMLLVSAFAYVLFLFHLLRSILRDVLAADVFTEVNAQRLARLGWLLVASAIWFPLSWFAFSLAVVRRAALAGAPLDVGIGFEFLTGVVPGVLVLVVAAAWRYGVELQKERDLTV